MKRLLALLCLICTPALATPGEPPPSGAGEPKRLFQLSCEDAEQAVSQALQDKGAGEHVAATIIGHSRAEPLFSYNHPISVELRGLTFNKDTSRWNASLLAVSDENVFSAIPVGGRFEEMVEVPVLKRQMRNNDIISENDVEMRSFAAARTRPETITDIKDLIGQSPVRVLSPGRPIRQQEIAGPTLVDKNSIVQMRYEIPGMEITATGQAMEDGSKGHMIAVRNLESKKIVHAVVSGKNTVMLRPMAVPAALQASSKTGASYAAN